MYFSSKVTLIIKETIKAFYLTSCGKAYFPMELSTISRQDRKKAREVVEVDIVPMSRKAVLKANKYPYIRQVVLSGDLKSPLNSLTPLMRLRKLFQAKKIRTICCRSWGQVIILHQGDKHQQCDTICRRKLPREIVVGDRGSIYILEIGKIRAVGLSQSQLEDIIYKRLIEEGFLGRFEMSLTGFNSKKVFIIVEGMPLSSIPYTNIPMYLGDVLSQVRGTTMLPGVDYKVSLIRDDKTFIISLRNLLRRQGKKIRLFPNDKIFVQPLNYRPETVILVGETGIQRSVLIDSNKRHTLSDVIFVSPALNNVTSDFSQIYVIRKSSSKFSAYHLDITNPARISFASQFEMRPDDIIFVATQPLSLYSRTLSQILGSTGLTIQARDTIRSDVGN